MQAIQVMTTEDQLETPQRGFPNTFGHPETFGTEGVVVWHDILWITQGFANGVYCTPKRAILMRDKIINPQICGLPHFQTSTGMGLVWYGVFGRCGYLDMHPNYYVAYDYDIGYQAFQGFLPNLYLSYGHEAP